MPKTKPIMSLTQFSVYDSKAELFATPFSSSNTATGIRMFESACNQKDQPFHAHGGDYTLFEIGVFDQDSGKLISHETPLNLGLAITFIQKD